LQNILFLTTEYFFQYGLNEAGKAEMRKMLFHKESNYIRLKRAKIDLSMFDMIKKIGVGAFGKVCFTFILC